MKRMIFRVAPLVVLLAIGGCGGNSYESIRKQQVETLKEALDVLRSIHDSGSAASARPQLTKLGNKWRDLDRRMAALPAPSADELNRAKGLDDELNRLQGQYVGEAIRVAFTPGGKEALDAIGDVKKSR